MTFQWVRLFAKILDSFYRKFYPADLIIFTKMRSKRPNPLALKIDFKKLIFVFLLVSISFCSYSQIFIGDSREVVKAVLEKKKVKFTEDSLTETTSRISWLAKNEFQAIWVFDNSDKVIRQTIIPKKPNAVNEFVSWFNKAFVVISDTEWKNYSNGIIYHIKLEHIGMEPLFSVLVTRMPQVNIFAPQQKD